MCGFGVGFLGMAVALDDGFMTKSGVADEVSHALVLVLRRHRVAHRFGYPFAGCSSAEPASVWPKFYDLGGRFLGRMRTGSEGSPVWLCRQ